MAQYYTDFSGDPLNSQPSGWTRQWTTNNTWTVKDFSGSRSLAWLDGPNGFEALILDAATSDSLPHEVVTRIFVGGGGSTEVNHGVSLFATSAGGYFVAIRGSQNEFNLARYTAPSTEVKIVNTTILNTLDVYVLIRARAESDGTIRGKVWADGDTEPAAWDFEINDGAFTTGESGVFARDGRSNDAYWDFFGVGTNGDVAPTSAPATGPNTPVNPSITNLLATSARLNWEQG